MATRTQIRRGTTTDNNNFKGFIGELTMDTTTKSLRIHDGSTTGGYKIPTLIASSISGNQWYRKYSDGWVEQGGFNISINENATVAITLPVTMKNTNYSALAQNNTLSTATDAENGVGIQRTSTTQITLFTHYINPNTISVSWCVYGYYQ